MDHETNINRRDAINTMYFGIILTPMFPIIWIALAGWLAFGSLMNGRYLISTIVFLVWLSACFVLNWLLLLVYVLASPKMKKGILGKHRFKITEIGLQEETEFNESLHKWPSMDKVVEIGKYVLVRVSGNQWHTFPLRSFASDAERKKFISELHKRIET